MSSNYFIAEIVVSHFPGSALEIDSSDHEFCRISYDGAILLTLDNRGVNYFFSNRYRLNRWGWDGIIEGSPQVISEIILRDLADYDFDTFDSRGRKLFKRPIKLDETTVCPKCNAIGSIKRYFFGQIGTSEFAKKLAKSRVILGRGRKKGDPEALCSSCDWTGSTEIFRFPNKVQ